MISPANQKLILALDFGRLNEALDMALSMAGLVGMFKINIQLFTAEGPDAVRKIGALGPGIFLDLKYHDIPNTVAGAISAAADLREVRLLDLHATGSEAMMRAAVRALAQKGANPPKLLGITILTSLQQKDLRHVGISGTPVERALSLARLGKQCGLDGVVASAKEVRRIRRGCGRDFLIVVPGIRPAESASRADDQARIATPTEAIRAGADYLVVGRPITAAADPPGAARAIAEEIAAALHSA
ncbi:MAG: orotidine-5'-phosphate decarboxylase [Acidobacteria bacterium]|nr:MAG: orotidine-5'-phosphate decarboxylase [Acidobacteriota bacterium]